MTAWDGGEYQARFDALAASGADMHGEADLVASLVAPDASVLDAGCGTGRVAIELARRGHPVVGTDLDGSMLAVARERAPGVEWVESDLAALDLGRRFAVVVMAGNVLLFTAPGTEAAVVAGCARHLAPGGLLVAGFQVGQRTTPNGATVRGYDVDDYDEACAAAGLTLVDRWSTWDKAPWPDQRTYAVSVHAFSRH
jgi:SAM-dependent methyltransferase